MTDKGVNQTVAPPQPSLSSVTPSSSIPVRHPVEEALLQSEGRFRAAIEAIQGVLWTNNAVGQMEGEQPGWIALTGQEYNDYQGYGWANAVHPDDAQPTIDAWNEAVNARKPFIFEHRLRVKSGAWNLFSIRAIPVMNDDGTIREWVGVHTDITESRQAERDLAASEQRYRSLSEHLDQQVIERTQELRVLIQDLERSNQNLQQFAYVASHDLQEPLRKILSFANLLHSRYATPLQDGIHYLDRIQHSAERMSVLIRDLLAYARISTRQENREPVPLNGLLQQILGDLDLAIEEAGATVEIGPLPTILGDSSQLGQLFQNLVNNALKFSQKQHSGTSRMPHVRVCAQPISADELPYSVQPTRYAPVYQRIDVIDNGIGFDQRYVSKIFQVFQRLHNKNEFVGTGIGLAICQKVAENHGGAITATGRPGEGATFHVFLPAHA